MATFEYGQDGSKPLSVYDIYNLFNNYRVWKYMMGMMIMLEKTELSSYKILEAGGGGGNKLRFFTELRAKPENCYGLDISEKAIEICKRLSPVDMNFQVASVLEMPFENSMFDIVLCSNIFGCFSNDEDVLKISDEIWRVIKFKGVLLIVDINQYFWATHRNNEDVFKAKGLRTFDTTKNELEKLLFPRFSCFRRQGVIGADAYALKGQLCDIDQLPSMDQDLDTGDQISSYTLYSFIPKP